MKVAAGEYICLEGDKANSLYIVKSGTILGSSKNSPEKNIQNFGPGSIIGEFSLLEDAPRECTLRAAENSEVLEIEQKALDIILDSKPSWLKSILTFLTARNHLAQEKKRKNDLIQSLPSLLYLFSSHLKETGTDNIPLELLHEKILAMNNTSAEEVDRLLKSLQELGLLKIQAKLVRAQSLQIVPILYETLRYRALNHKVSPNILSMTDQMILSAFTKLARESKIPLRNGLCSIAVEKLMSETKKTMHGFTLTSRTIAPLIQKRLLQTSTIFDIHTPLEKYDYIFADLDRILDLLELNRIFPLLDKKLVE